MAEPAGELRAADPEIPDPLRERMVNKMYNSKITLQVKRKKKAGTGLLKGAMIFFGVLFILMGIMLSRGFMLSGFLLVVLYFFYDTFSKKEYEYVLEGSSLSISVIWGG